MDRSRTHERDLRAFARALATHADGVAVLTGLLRDHARTTALAFDAVGAEIPSAARPAHAAARRALRHAIATRSDALLLLTNPAIATPLHARAARDAVPELGSRIDAARDRTVSTLLVELALRGHLDAPVEVPAPFRVASPTLAVEIEAPPDTDRVVIDATGLAAYAGVAPVGVLRFDAPDAHHGFVVRLAYRTLRGATRIALVDHNPLACVEAHPDKSGNALSLGDRPLEAWHDALDAALSLIEAHVPEIAASMALLLREIVPVGFEAERHLSASYREAIGTVYLTLHPDPLTMAEALVHEFQHNVLNLASYTTEFLRNAFEPRYPSPVRPDPRPLWGILLAAHAFLPIATFYRRLRAHGHSLAARPAFEARLASVDLKNHEAVAMLDAHADWTPAGRALMDELSGLDSLHLREREAQGLSGTPTEAHTA